MARDENFAAPVIFLHENGRPMEFYMKPCSLKNTLLPIIENGGGMLTSELTTSEEIIRLTDPKKPVEGFVSSDFIFDSIEKKFLQDIDKYIIKSKKTNQAKKVVRHQDNKNNSNTIKTKHSVDLEGLSALAKNTKRIVRVVRYEEISDTEDPPPPSIKKKHKKTRSKYTLEEDKAIVNYIEKEDRDGLIKGNTIWKEMARLKVTNHSWQSMRSHYLDILKTRKNSHQRGQKTRMETCSTDKRTSSAQESESPRKKFKSSDSDSSEKEGSIDSDNVVETNLLTRQRRKENKERPRAVTRGQHKASKYNDDTAEQTSGGVVITDDQPLNQRAVTRGQHKASSSNDATDDQTSGGVVTRRQQKDSDFTDDQPLNQRAVTRGKHKASSSNDVTDDQTSGGVVTRRQQKDSDFTDDQPLNQRAVTRGQHKASKYNDDTDDQTSEGVVITDDQPWNQRATTRRHKKAIETEKDEETYGGRATRRQQKELDSNDDTDNQRVRIRKHKRVIESDSSSEDEAETRRQKENEGVEENELGEQSLPDNDFDAYSQAVPRQKTPVFHRKDKDRHGTPATRKNRYPTRGGVPSPQGKASSPKKVSDINPEVRVTMAPDLQDGVEWESDADEFDQRLLSMAEKASFERSCQESHDHEEGSEDETSAKDTQEDDEDEYIFRRQNRRKRTERNKNQGTSSVKEKRTDNEEARTVRVTRGQSSTEKTSVVAQVNSVARVNSTSKDVSSSSATSPSNRESTSKSPWRGRKRHITPETCSRNLFGDDADENESTHHRTRGKTRKEAESTVKAKSPDDDEMWLYVEKMAEKYQKVERLPCTQGMARSQLLHALYVSDGTLKDTESYVKTGKLANGASPWSNEENDAILSNERETVNAIIKKRGQGSVLERRSFLLGCK